MAVGKVYLVGAGPGDPLLLTMKGKQLLAAADVIVYDRLISPRLLQIARADATCYDVGKQSGQHTLAQAEIQALLVQEARAGKTVVRLKGGDPFVFGRGGEEALALAVSGIGWEVVPGITSAVAVPAYAGIPVTHRELAPSFTVVTGHRSGNTNGDDAVIRAAQTDTTGTLVILMGVSQLPDIVHSLRLAGRPGNLPAAAIRWGTRAAQETLVGTVDTIAQLVRSRGFEAPAVIVVGNVVRLRASLSWFEAKPLMGRRVLVFAGSRARAAAMSDAVEAQGAESLDLSLEALVIPNDVAILELQGNLGNYGAVLFSSTVSVRRFFELWRAQDNDIRALLGVSFRALTEAVAECLREHGIEPDDVWIRTEHHGRLGRVERTRLQTQISLELSEGYRRMRQLDTGLFVEELGFECSVPDGGAVTGQLQCASLTDGPSHHAVRAWPLEEVDAVWSESAVTSLQFEHVLALSVRQGRTADFSVLSQSEVLHSTAPDVADFATWLEGRLGTLSAEGCAL